jgi:transposase
MNPYRDINDEEWQRVAPLLPELRPRSELRGRPLANTRSVLNGVLWVMYSGATWSAMPRKYPSYQTCHRRFKAWYESGVLNRVMESVEAEKAPVVAPAVYSPPSSQPLPSSPFAFHSPFKHAA